VSRGLRSRHALEEKAQSVSGKFLAFYGELSGFASKESVSAEISQLQTKYLHLKKAMDEKQRVRDELQARRKKADFFKECELLRMELKGLTDQRSVLRERVAQLGQAADQ